MESLSGSDRYIESLIYTMTLRKAFSHGGACYVAQEGDRYFGVAVWLPPGLDWTFWYIFSSCLPILGRCGTGLILIFIARLQ